MSEVSPEMAQAAALGVFDDITHLVPVLYMGSKTNAPEATATTLAASGALSIILKSIIELSPMTTRKEKGKGNEERKNRGSKD